MLQGYKVEISFSAESLYPKCPYCWVLYQVEEESHVVGAGWSETPERAFQEAFAFAKRYKGV